MKKILLLTALLFNLFANAQIINFPDANFKAKLLAETVAINSVAFDIFSNPIVIDSNNDGEIQQAEVLNVSSLYIYSSSPAITDITGIEYFINLKSLHCYDNLISNIDVLSNLSLLETIYCDLNLISNIDSLASLPNLTYLSCDVNQLTNININNFTSLIGFSCQNNQLTNLDISNNPLLSSLNCGGNQLTNLDLSNNPALTNLYCYDNQLTNLDLSNNPLLSSLFCDNNQLTSINVSINAVLGFLYCNNNQLTDLNLGANSELSFLECNNNLLTSLNIKNNSIEYISFSGNPNLQYICADTNQLANVQNLVTSYGYTNCVVDSSCISLSNQNFNLAETFSISPNPVKDSITIDTTISITTINIYNALGQLLKVIPNAKDIKTIDVSNLNNGNYFMKIETRDGVVNEKFIKI